MRDNFDHHEGGAILLMGMGSLVVFCIPFIAIPLGLAACLWGFGDLYVKSSENRSGWIGQTLAGCVCGAIGAVLSFIVSFAFVLFFFLGNAALYR